MDRHNDFVNLLIFLLRIFLQLLCGLVGVSSVTTFMGTREGKSCNKLALSCKDFVSASVPLTKVVEPRIEHFRAALSLERE